MPAKIAKKKSLAGFVEYEFYLKEGTKANKTVSMLLVVVMVAAVAALIISYLH